MTVRDDFAEVRYEICASCHVPGAAATGMTAAQQQQWRAAEHQWPVTWHGTDDANGKCAACHARTQRDGREVLGPALRTVVRPVLTAEEHAAERARYTVARRSHEQQFTAHANGRECTQCHKPTPSLSTLVKVDREPACDNPAKEFPANVTP